MSSAVPVVPAVQAAPACPRLPVFNRFTRSLPRKKSTEPEPPQVDYASLTEILSLNFQSDAHFVAYACPALPHRLGVDLVRDPEHADLLARGAPEMRAVVFDIDGPDHTASNGWREGERAKWPALLAAHPGLFLYETRGGYRVVGVLAEPVPIRTPADAAEWSRRYAAWVAYLARCFRIVADSRCADWTRLYRVPRATRDGVLEERPSYGDAAAIGVWTCEPSEEDFATVGHSTPPAAAGGGSPAIVATHPEFPWRIEQATRWLDDQPACISGQGGQAQIWRVVCELTQGFEFSPDDALALLAAYNERCVPPWSEDELRHHLENAAKQRGLFSGWRSRAFTEFATRWGAPPTYVHAVPAPTEHRVPSYARDPRPRRLRRVAP
ncbi:MAG: hypothetical protein JOZ69_23320 [Myxococcales bacterium]|nr:hypothetical protein [Myxococcales bacterium]